jgi:hypothetical protein
MASESSGTGFGTRLFKFYANIINVVVIVIWASEDQTFMSILKMFASI